MDVLSAVAHRWANETDGIAFDTGTYAPLMERARSLDARPRLPEGLRGTVEGLAARDEFRALNRVSARGLSAGIGSRRSSRGQRRPSVRGKT